MNGTRTADLIPKLPIHTISEPPAQAADPVGVRRKGDAVDERVYSEWVNGGPGGVEGGGREG